ncbi:MAG TPA: ReoY family proteolytic degradation factor [Bacillales bacterium]|nr:ReoY family proteolytic degradation factor [Bacillales bacterium]
MSFVVSLSDKKQFIRWFLDHFELKKRECIWLLNFLSSDDDLMENVHFIRHAEYCPKAIIMSTRCTQDVPFQYFKKHVMTVEPEKAFHDIRLYREEALYIQMNFKNHHTSPELAAVLEENPYYDEQISDTYSELADNVIHESEKQFERNHLLHLVDMALDAEDEEWFYELTGKLYQTKHPTP